MPKHETPDWFDDYLEREEIDEKEYYLQEGRHRYFDPDLERFISPREQFWAGYWEKRGERERPEPPEQPISLNISTFLRWLFGL